MREIRDLNAAPQLAEEFPQVPESFIRKLTRILPYYRLPDFRWHIKSLLKNPSDAYDWIEICIVCGDPRDGDSWYDHIETSSICRIVRTHSEF